MFDHAPHRPLFALLIGPDVRLARGVLTKLNRPADLTVLTKPNEVPNADADEHISSDHAPFARGSFDVVITPPNQAETATPLLAPGGRAIVLPA